MCCALDVLQCFVEDIQCIGDIMRALEIVQCIGDVMSVLEGSQCVGEYLECIWGRGGAKCIGGHHQCIENIIIVVEHPRMH